MSTYTETRKSALERFPDAEENAYRLDCIAALLGANAEWEGADFLEYIAEEVREARAPGTPSHQSDEPESLGFWRKIADAYSIGHDGEDEEPGEIFPGTHAALDALTIRKEAR